MTMQLATKNGSPSFVLSKELQAQEMARVIDILDSVDDCFPFTCPDPDFEPIPIAECPDSEAVSLTSSFCSSSENSASRTVVNNPTCSLSDSSAKKRSQNVVSPTQSASVSPCPPAKRRCLSGPPGTVTDPIIKPSFWPATTMQTNFSFPYQIMGKGAPMQPIPTTFLIRLPRDDDNQFRDYQTSQWKTRVQELTSFKEKHGHCLVPHNFPSNPSLAQWIKRHRYQYKLKQLGRHSTLTDAREKELIDLGFVWDSQKGVWMDRLEELTEYKTRNGNCNVPSNYHDRRLAVWVKCQRRQFKLYKRGRKSTMTVERYQALEALEFDWNPRNLV